jgi:hypothetical protein
LLVDDWTLFDQNIMGEWYTYLILNKAFDETYRLSESQAQEAAEGWGGDAYAIYLDENTNQTIFIMDTLWDTTKDANEFINAFKQYASERWEPDSSSLMDADVWQGTEYNVAFWHVDNRTLWVMAPDNNLLERVLAELQ